MMNAKTFYNRLIVFTALLSAAGIFTFFHNHFSPVGSLHGNGDPACFYMAGRAILHGYVPYVDFVDVKGPLLFLFFALGEAFGGVSGVALLFVITLFLSLLAFYKISCLYIKNRGFCILSAIFPLLLLLCPGFDAGGRAEEIVLPFMSWAIYLSLRYIRELENKNHLTFASCFLGVCGAVSLFSKYNITLPFFSLWVYLFLCSCCRDKRMALICFLSCGAGFLAISLPTVLYMIYTHSLYDFFSVYFILNFETYAEFSRTCSLANKVLTFFFRCVGVPFSVLCLLIPPFKTVGKFRFCSDQVLLAIVAASLILCCVAGWPYYYLISLPLIHLAGVSIAYPMSQCYPEFKSSVALLLTPPLVLSFLSLTNDAETGLKNIFRQQQEKFSRLDAVINTRYQPKLIYLNFLDLGLGVKSGALPACPSWTHLNGAPEYFEARQRECVRSGAPDFVITTTAADHKVTVEVNGVMIPQADWLKTCHYAYVDSQAGLSLYKKEERKE